jgi:hypothetical protein
LKVRARFPSAAGRGSPPQLTKSAINPLIQAIASPSAMPRIGEATPGGHDGITDERNGEQGKPNKTACSLSFIA